MRHERGSLPLDGTSDALDRLAGLCQVISPAVLQQALAATGKHNPRRCCLTHEVMLWVVLAMGVFTAVPIRQVFKRCRRLRFGERTPTRSALCEARQRLGVEPVRHVFGQVVRPLATPQTPGAFYRGRRLVGLDGTVSNVPDSPANAAAFARATGSRGEGAFPQIRKVSAVELGTHVEFALVHGGWQNSEQELTLQLLTALPDDALVLADRNFFSFSLWNKLTERRLALLFRIKKNQKLEPLQVLSDGSYLAKVYASSADRAADRDGILVRVIEYTHHDPQRVGCGERHRLLTTLLEETVYPALEVACLYHERWEEELVYDEQKTHQDPRRASKPANLRSETPEGVRQEVYALSLAHFVVRALMSAAAMQAEADVDSLSFTGCLQVRRCRLPECPDATPACVQRWYAALLWEMQQERVEPRRNRINPRVVKQKMSKFAKKRPEHRGIPPLKKRFAEIVVMLN